jgi:hypothetical protein
MVLRCGWELGSHFHLLPVPEGEQTATDPFHPRARAEESV